MGLLQIQFTPGLHDARDVHIPGIMQTFSN
jgi:hypothetical protein